MSESPKRTAAGKFYDRALGKWKSEYTCIVDGCELPVVMQSKLEVMGDCEIDAHGDLWPRKAPTVYRSAPQEYCELHLVKHAQKAQSEMHGCLLIVCIVIGLIWWTRNWEYGLLGPHGIFGGTTVERPEDFDGPGDAVPRPFGG
jgi:hypothetical protein